MDHGAFELDTAIDHCFCFVMSTLLEQHIAEALQVENHERVVVTQLVRFDGLPEVLFRFVERSTIEIHFTQELIHCSECHVLVGGTSALNMLGGTQQSSLAFFKAA